MGIIGKRGRPKIKPESKVEAEPTETKPKDEIISKVGKGSKLIRLKNDFHKTETTFNISDDGTGILSGKDVERIKDKLYGDGCRFCGDKLGARGDQDVFYNLTDLEGGGLQITIIG